MKLIFGLAPLCCVATAPPALAQVVPAPAGAQSGSSDEATPSQKTIWAQPVADKSDQPAQSQGSGTDIFSKNVITVLFDARMVVANGETSFINRGLGKTAFQGNSNGGYKFYAIPVEGDLIWTPRFTNSLSASVSAAWQRDQEHVY